MKENVTTTSQNVTLTSQDATATSQNVAAAQLEAYTIRQASKLLGVKTGTLRHYCNLGLIPGLKRNLTGQRIFSESQFNQLRNIVCFFRCGLTSHEVKTYLRSSPAEQKQILGTKKQQLWQKLDDLRQNIDFIERQEDLLG